MLIPFGFHEYQNNFTAQILFWAPDCTITALGCNSGQHISLLYGNMKLVQPYVKKFLSVQTYRQKKRQA